MCFPGSMDERADPFIQQAACGFSSPCLLYGVLRAACLLIVRWLRYALGRSGRVWIHVSIDPLDERRIIGKKGKCDG